MTVAAWALLGVWACLVLSGCMTPLAVSSDQGPAPGAYITQRNEAAHLMAFAEPRSLTDGIELNVTGPIALRFALTVPGEQNCKLTFGLEYRTAGHGLSYMAIHQKGGGWGTGSGMGRQDTAIDAGPIDNRGGGDPNPGSSRITWSAGSGNSTVTMVVLYAEPNDSDFVDNGSVLLKSTCDDSQARLTEAGFQVTTWHAQTLNGTALASQGGLGVVLDRHIEATFEAQRTIMAASHSGETIGQISFRGPEVDETMTLPLKSLITAEGGPGTYETHLDAVGGTMLWGFMAGVDPVQA